MVTKSSFDAVAVYSTEHGRLCPGCGRPTAKCQCSSRIPPKTSDGIIRIGRQTKGRKGSGVTTVSGLNLAPAPLRQLAGKLKKQCGAGGAIKDGVIEIQGEHRDTLVSALQKLGYTVKRVGG
ncbi:translation initiation factor Sui1 [Desulfobulbus rhabdoformis]|uniref:translation initiation factor Sui1 n=1 Tax=Desulfobulbus rhabdoformis TaxID=34032 RepID=UPI0019660422|nr:translation initiation factor Sui1 [Desulfobulbus rhabdoformis]MBM9615371.1 translation initiation factor Sui1 [Desulfobulbus rhabdoformis]